MASLTLADLGRRLDPSGKVADMAELMSQCNELVDDWPMVEGNLTTGHVVTIRTALPQGTARRFNKGVGYTKSSAAQLTFGMMMLDAYSQIDKKLADLGGNSAANREKEDVAHLEGLILDWACAQPRVRLLDQSCARGDALNARVATFFSPSAVVHRSLHFRLCPPVPRLSHAAR
jgi:hypothetical protein